MKKIVILDAGHGCDTAGKCWPEIDDGTQVQEWEFNRDIVASLALRDTVIVQTVPGDTVWLEVPAKKIDITEPYIELHGYATDNEFVGAVTTRDTLLITETVKYKRFWGFLWKTNKIKNREFDIVSRNPYTQINDFEVITIEE